MAAPVYRGVFPVAPTIFDDEGRLDLEGQKRAIDFMIDAGSHGVCILANFSEQFALSDAERDTVQRTVLEHVAGRVPVIVTTTHFSSRICAERSRAAQDAGAAMVMIMPPYHGATIRVNERGIHEFFREVSNAIDIPIMIQDAPVAGTPLSASFLGPWDGEEAITLMPDFDAGATGAMTGGGYPDGIRKIVDAYFAGDTDKAAELYQQWLPLINYENRQCGLAACKSLMKEGGVIRSDAVRHPLAPMQPAVREGLLKVARRLDPLVLRWGH
jgi:4-hydroxy-tetrahydrodipicolinate synthase